ncbi:MAG: electron transport complex subunit RsxC [Oscillospiraceae bacterium]|nr:electron transport complex subunit RsxC [Oscillospiraceae bacterium]MBQ1590287.1 electron transport complex subunit RsxC [Oscillospiraceae bacterium]
MRITFRGGVHPKGHKDLSSEAPLRPFNPGGEMVFPLSQHIGKPAKAVVKKNDPVLAGQVIGEADGFVSANVICSCSGKVAAVEKRRTISGQLLECVVVENDGQFTPAADYETRRDLSNLTDRDILDAVKAAGIVGLGGAGFPTHVKLAPKNPDAIRYVIANGAECEPYLTCNDQLMRTKAAEIVEGLELILRLFPNAEGVIGIEKNKPQAIAAMEQAASGKKRISVRALETKYPQGGEHNLIKVIVGADYPVKMLPADMGCIVDNVGTIYAIQRAVCYGEPLFTHVLTVTGEAIAKPGNFIVRDGTNVRELLEECGGFREDPKKVLAGGPMMGFALGSLEVPVVKTTNGLTCLVEDGVELARKRVTHCLGCGRCTTVCPTGLLPGLMADAVRKGDYERYEKKLYGLECVACGSCTYICPANRPLTETFKRVKAEIMAQKRAAQAGGKK